jgi:signal peptidase I
MGIFRRHQNRQHLINGLLLAKKLSDTNQEDSSFTRDLLRLDEALKEKKDDAETTELASNIAKRVKESKKKTFLRSLIEFLLTIVIAIAAAAVIRQTCFELYEIPTGSMRPTFKEKDRVFVSKSTYGINIPFLPSHLFFSPCRVARGDDVVITAENLDIPDVDTIYFGIFPGVKRYTKRLVALPGDTVYFYGGDLYYVAKDDTQVHQLSQNPAIPRREYLPFISSFEGRIESLNKEAFTDHRTFVLKHFNLPIGRIELEPDGRLLCQIPKGSSWIEEFSTQKFYGPQCFGEFFGIKNFALVRAFLPSDLPNNIKKSSSTDKEAMLWLQLHHSPTLPLSKRPKNPSLIQYSTTYLPLHASHLDALSKTLYTARFVVENNAARRYYFEPTNLPSITLPSPVPDGCYEFYNGKAYQITFGGTAKELPKSHSLYPKTPAELAFWINFGIDFLPECAKTSSPHMPTRFAYFNNGTLYVMGGAVLEKDDPILRSFTIKELARQAKDYSYFAFQDAHGKDGEALTSDFIKAYGLKIPEKSYLLLGDNPAMSQDSRYFGVVSEDNLQGTPVLLFWPFGERWGWPLQPSKAPSIYTITLLFLFLLATYAYKRHRRTKAMLFLQKLQTTSKS